ncbi:MAG: nucleotide pyrophosphohydrolase, partial [Candidatus Heimdallarchaeota archaeon]|nr:nucleotide pyrophosphohydrolase [Candidatus Heimdallarchaeota archaeon]
IIFSLDLLNCFGIIFILSQYVVINIHCCVKTVVAILKKQSVVKGMTKKKEQFDILKEKMIQFLKERDWEKFHTPKNVAMSIAIEAAELMELLQWSNPEITTVISNQELISQIKDEIADIVIYTVSLGLSLNIDIFESVLAKMDKNLKRFPPKSELK